MSNLKINIEVFVREICFITSISVAMRLICVLLGSLNTRSSIFVSFLLFLTVHIPPSGCIFVSLLVFLRNNQPTHFIKHGLSWRANVPSDSKEIPPFFRKQRCCYP
jgi:hypothetical protein